MAGAVAIQYLSGTSNWVSVNILIVEGVLLTVVLIADPDGLVGIAASLVRRLPASRSARLPLGPPRLSPNSPSSPTGPRSPAHARVRTGSMEHRAGHSRPNGTSSRPRWGCPGPGATGVRGHWQGVRRADRAGRRHADAAAARLFGLCGPNGAGKSTLLAIIGGSVPPARGRVLLDGADVTRLPENISQVLAAMEVIAPDGTVTLYNS